MARIEFFKYLQKKVESSARNFNYDAHIIHFALKLFHKYYVKDKIETALINTHSVPLNLWVMHLISNFYFCFFSQPPAILLLQVNAVLYINIWNKLSLKFDLCLVVSFVKTLVIRIISLCCITCEKLCLGYSALLLFWW